MTENINPDAVLQQLEIQLAELVRVRDWLNERIRLIRESIERLRKQAQVNEQLALDPPSKAFLLLLADLTAVEVTHGGDIVLDEPPKAEEVVGRSTSSHGGKPKSYGVIPLLQQVLETLVRDNIPESVSEALATTYGDSWTDKSFSLFMGPGERVVVSAYFRGEVPEDFRKHLAQAFLKLRTVHLNQVPDGFVVSKKLLALAEQSAANWKWIEQVVVENWLPEELAHLRTRK